jgi:hypothetical protein
VRFGLCRSARSIALTSRFGRICDVNFWESGLGGRGRGCGSGLVGVASWGLEVLGGGGRFWFRAWWDGWIWMLRRVRS